MLFGDPAHRDDLPGRQRQRDAEDGLRLENAFGMVAQRTMTRIRQDLLRSIEPLVDRQIVLHDPAPTANGREGVMIGMGHHRDVLHGNPVIDGREEMGFLVRTFIEHLLASGIVTSMDSVECAYRFRFYPTLEQTDLLNRTFGCVRVVYNRARILRETAWTERKEKIGFSKTNTMLTVLKKEQSFVWLNEVSSVPLQQCLRHLDTAYRNFFQGRARYPQFRRKDGTQSAEFTRSGFRYRDGQIVLAKMKEPLAVIWSRTLPGEPSTVTVTREPDGRWYISCRVLAPVETYTGGGAIGVDLGLMDLAILSTGEKIANPRHLVSRQTKLACLQRRLSRKQKGSKNRAKARLKVARAHAGVRDARRDFLHKLSSRLVRENQTICLETLSVKGMLRAKRHSRSIADAGWSELVRQVSYKAQWHGREVIRIDRFHPSTRTCSACGTTGHSLSLSDRHWTCPDCHTAHDRDVNAACNILAAGLAVTACGGDVRPRLHPQSGQTPVKQELAS